MRLHLESFREKLYLDRSSRRKAKCNLWIIREGIQQRGRTIGGLVLVLKIAPISIFAVFVDSIVSADFSFENWLINQEIFSSVSKKALCSVSAESQF